MPEAGVRRRSALRWGVRALAVAVPRDTDEMISLMAHGLVARGVANPGDVVVMAASSPAGRSHTNLLKVHHLARPE
jgi:pyruvate kinase